MMTRYEAIVSPHPVGSKSLPKGCSPPHPTEDGPSEGRLGRKREQTARQKIEWETPQLKGIKVAARHEAIGAARSAVELEAAKPDAPRRYRFGPRRWVIGEPRTLREVLRPGGRLDHLEVHTLEGPTIIGSVNVTDGGGRGTVTASIFSRGLKRLGVWSWSEAPTTPQWVVKPGDGSETHVNTKTRS